MPKASRKKPFDAAAAASREPRPALNDQVARPLARLQPDVVRRPRLVRLRRANADIHEPGAVLKGRRHRPKYASELLPIKN